MYLAVLIGFQVSFGSHKLGAAREVFGLASGSDGSVLALAGLVWPREVSGCNSEGNCMNLVQARLIHMRGERSGLAGAWPRLRS